jgi:ABC-2 type transport system permease protein
MGPFSSDTALVASREVRERFRGRIFRVGTVIMLLAVCAAIIIPTLDHSTPSPTVLGVYVASTAPVRADIRAAAASSGDTMRFVSEPSVAAVHRDLKSGRIDLAIIDNRSLLVDHAISSTDTSDAASMAQALAQSLGVTEAFENAGLTTSQSSDLQGAKAVPILSLQGATSGSSKGNSNEGISIIGLILTFVMLTQYNTWILIGVMEEKSSRVIEVLLAAVRPVRLLAGKVLGIGMVAFTQAALIVLVALIVAEASGSTILHGAGLTVIGSTLVWLVLGYAFYCWVYAAAGSMAERQDQVQSLAFPLSLPVIVGYIISLITLETGNASLFFKVLAYLPPTAPFAMPALVGLHEVAWWQFVGSAGLSIVATYLVAQLAARIYLRAILRTGRRVRVREVVRGV